MKKIRKLALLLLLTQIGYAEVPQEISKEAISIPYPIFYDNSDTFYEEEPNEPKSKKDASEKVSPTAQQATVGKVKITLDAENMDFISQQQYEREKRRKKEEPEKDRRRSNQDKEEEKDHAPRFKFSMKWSSED